MWCWDQMLFGTLAADADGSPQLRLGGRLQGFTRSSGSTISVPSSPPRVLSKGHKLYYSSAKKALL